MQQHWFTGPLASFDTETTGVDVESDRIVSAALVVQPAPGAAPVATSWLADPGVPIPDGARAVHGIDDARVRAFGRPAAVVVAEVAAALAEQARAGRPVVVMNAPYDLTLLDRELRRRPGDVAGRGDRSGGAAGAGPAGAGQARGPLPPGPHGR